MITWILCTYGVAFWLCFKLPFKKESLPQFFQDLFSCMFCTGFWSGIIAALLCFWNNIFSLSFGLHTLALLTAYGFAGACTAYTLDTIIQRIERDGK